MHSCITKIKACSHKEQLQKIQPIVDFLATAVAQEMLISVCSSVRRPFKEHSDCVPPSETKIIYLIFG